MAESESATGSFKLPLPVRNSRAVRVAQKLERPAHHACAGTDLRVTSLQRPTRIPLVKMRPRPGPQLPALNHTHRHAPAAHVPHTLSRALPFPRKNGGGDIRVGNQLTAESESGSVRSARANLQPGRQDAGPGRPAPGPPS